MMGFVEWLIAVFLVYITCTIINVVMLGYLAWLAVITILHIFEARQERDGYPEATATSIIAKIGVVSVVLILAVILCFIIGSYSVIINSLTCIVLSFGLGKVKKQPGFYVGGGICGVLLIAQISMIVTISQGWH